MKNPYYENPKSFDYCCKRSFVIFDIKNEDTFKDMKNQIKVIIQNSIKLYPNESRTILHNLILKNNIFKNMDKDFKFPDISICINIAHNVVFLSSNTHPDRPNNAQYGRSYPCLISEFEI